MEYQSVIEYLTSSIGTFVGDPPDSDFQRGYLAALQEVQEMILTGRIANLANHEAKQ